MLVVFTAHTQAQDVQAQAKTFAKSSTATEEALYHLNVLPMIQNYLKNICDIHLNAKTVTTISKNPEFNTALIILCPKTSDITEEQYLQAVTPIFEEHFTPEQVVELNDIYRSPIWQAMQYKIKEASINLSTPDWTPQEQAAMQRFFDVKAIQAIPSFLKDKRLFQSSLISISQQPK